MSSINFEMANINVSKYLNIFMLLRRGTVIIFIYQASQRILFLPQNIVVRENTSCTQRKDPLLREQFSSSQNFHFSRTFEPKL